MADDSGKFIKFLPSVFQTSTERKFFDSTFDQVFSKADNEVLNAYLGRRAGNHYNPAKDYFIPEPTKDRTWWQLEATSFARSTDNSKENIFFYDDLLNKINYYGGNTLNQDRLFASEYYSWCPPIDPDMFINYQNYYWIAQGLPVITITGGLVPIVASDIVGQTTYTTPADATPPNVTLSSGMRIQLPQDPGAYQQPHTVDNVGDESGIRLIAEYPDYISQPSYEFLPWDGIFRLSNSRVINNTHWDVGPWEVQTSPFVGDYITIARGSVDQNAWSRTNKWYHIDVINETVALTGTPFPNVATRALRPIIQFNADLQLFGSGTQFKSSIQYGYTSYSNNAPILLSAIQNQPLNVVNAALGSSLVTGDLVAFFNDTTTFATTSTVNLHIFKVSIQPGNIVQFNDEASIISGDIVFITQTSTLSNNPSKGQSWYYQNGIWQGVTNDKFKANQPPLFQLYDHNYAELNSYNNSDFAGSKIFSYKVNPSPGAFVDPVLGFPIVYTSLGQASDIVFENNLMTDRYTYESGTFPIQGYYYYKHVAAAGVPASYGNSWNLYVPVPGTIAAPAIAASKQRVVDRYVVGYNTSGPQTNATPDNILKFKLSVIPYGYPTNPEIIVAVNGVSVPPTAYTFETLNADLYINLTAYLSGWDLTINAAPPVVEAFTYTHDELNPLKPGYFEIPQQLEANPRNDEIFETSASNLTNQFASIISNQAGFIGTSFGGDNNFRDTAKNLSLGTFILQNRAPLLKTMLVSGSGDLEYINANRFSSAEYTKFKVKYLRTAQQLINQQFTPAMTHYNTVVVSDWVDQIFKTINISKEFSNAFAYSFMIAANKVYAEEEVIATVGSTVLTHHIDIADPRNVIYVYNLTAGQSLLLVDKDYTLSQTSPIDPVEITFNFSAGNVSLNDVIDLKFYQNPLPTYIPSTPSKIGTYAVYEPRVEFDYSYAIPVPVIVGHDGSRTVAKGDYTDDLILELEKRIYMGIPYKFRTEYKIPLYLQEVKSGYFRKTRYTRDEYLDITESYLNKWSSKYSANYRLNEYDSFYQDVPTNNQWMLWNYSTALDATTLQPLNLPGNWKGIFDFYYDTIRPDIAPWEMLGLSIEPDWWTSAYGNPILNSNGQYAWASDAAGTHTLWDDLEDGIIRQGPCATFDPVTGNALPNKMWARPGLSQVLPVDTNGDIVPVYTIFNVSVNTVSAPFVGFDDPWVYGDGSPVEQAWYNSSEYAFSTNEFLYLMNPAALGELYFDTVGTEYSPNDQYVQNNLYLPYDFYVQTDEYFNDGVVGSGDPYFTWMRPRNQGQIVHGESLPDSTVAVRFGYQRWVSDYLLFLGKDVTASFGHRVRTLDVNLANKFAGFTNKDTARVYLESITPNATTTGLLIPSTNFDVRMHVGQPIATYSYSGVIVRALADGTFAVYGYDLLNPEFTVFTRQTTNAQNITIGGTPVAWINFQTGASYSAGTIVRYNGVYYQSKAALVNVVKFDATQWTKLKSLPISGGVSVTYYPVPSPETVKIAYGTVLSSVQDVFDLLIGWGDYLEFTGWKFEDVNKETSEVSNWLYSAKQFLFWTNTQWAPDASIQLSPLANAATLQISSGYPANVEKIANGVYSILDKFGVAINPKDTTIERKNQIISIIPTTLEAGGIYYAQVSANETEHVLMFDNRTNFNDVIYDPLYRSRQEKLRFNGFRSKNWFGKMEAPGYLILENQLLPNYDTLVEDVKYFYDPNVTIDNPSAESLGRHLIGYESKSFLDNLQISDDIQYLFYQGMIRQKGTRQSFNKLFRSTSIVGNSNYSSIDEKISVYEEWALKLADFGNTIEQVTTEFKLSPEENRGEVIVARLNYIPDTVGFVKLINIMNAETTYTTPPKITISAPASVPQATLTLLAGSITDVDLTNAGDGYTAVAPIVTIAGDGSGATAVAYVEYGFVTHVDITSPGIGYTTATISFSPPPGVRTATAYAVLDSFGKIARVDISDKGYGYTSNPEVLITPNVGTVDKLYAVFQGEILVDEKLDNIIDIDIDETNIWTVRPPEPSYSLIFPTTEEVYYGMPDAGYANKNDVNWLSFDTASMFDQWGTRSLTPVANETVWIAKDKDEDWDILKLVQTNFSTPFAVPTPTPPVATTGYSTIVNGSITHVAITNAGAGYISEPSIIINGDGTGATATATISGGKVTQIILTSVGSGYTFATVSISASGTGNNATADTIISDGVVSSVIIDNVNDAYLYPPTVSFSGGNGTGAFAVATLDFDGYVSSVTVTYGGSGYTSAPVVSFSPPQITNTGSNTGFEIYTDDSKQLTLSVLDRTIVENNEFSGISLQRVPTGLNTEPGNYLVTLTYDGARVETTQWTSTISPYVTYDVVTTWHDYAIKDSNDIPLTTDEIPDYAELNTIYVFKSMRFLNELFLPSYVVDGDKMWVDRNLSNKWAVYTVELNAPVLYREQSVLIDTKQFENAQIFQFKNQQSLALLPVYDPFKNILPNLAEQNITYKSYQDPARYNVTADPKLYSQNKTFGKAQVGQLWWDFSDCRYFYYEQPIALDGSETENDNLLFVRDNWGQFFPGSAVSIYEWVESTVPPSDYTGTGTPRSITDIVQITSFNSFTNIIESRYYFWVKGATNQPNLQNRTLPAAEVARLLTNPKSQGYAFFTPIQQTSINNSYMFYNVSDILAYKGNNVQVKYKTSSRDDQIHTQWGFYREGDESSAIPAMFWNKFVDSICAYTDVLPITGQYSDSILVPGGQVLPVPDPGLGDAEKYGVQIRPRQSMFVNVQEARKIFYQAANKLLINVPIRDINPLWDTGVSTSVYWKYVNWYEVGYENVAPQVQFTTLTEANTALSAGLLSINEIVKVIQGTVAATPADARFALYAVTSVANSSSVYLKLVGYELSAIQILPTIYTVKNVYELSVELRELLAAIKDKIFVNMYAVDTNLLFFAMLNFVVSEQKNLDWVFKSSYIYIKEENIPLTQSGLYIPNQIENVVGYINDVKPYHTQIRDYTTSYALTDVAIGTAVDILNQNITIKFGPNIRADRPWTGYNLFNADNFDVVLDGVAQGSVQEQTANYDSSKVGFSALYPYTFIAGGTDPYAVPASVIAVSVNSAALAYGQDYYVIKNNDNTYTIYLFNDYGPSAVVLAYVLIDGAGFQQMPVDPYRNELAFGNVKDNLVINVDTMLPVYENGDVLVLWDMVDPRTGTEIGFDSQPWDTGFSEDVVYDDAYVVSYKENLNVQDVTYIPWDTQMWDSEVWDAEVAMSTQFYRNNNSMSGLLTADLLVDEETFSVSGPDVFQTPSQSNPGSVWINGEKINYDTKVYSSGITTFSDLYREQDDTVQDIHLMNTRVFATQGEHIMFATDLIWNGSVPTAYVDDGHFAAPNPGGIWYANTPQAEFLKDGQGEAT